MRDDALARDRLDRRGRYPEGCIQRSVSERHGAPVRREKAAAIRVFVLREALARADNPI